MSGGGKGLGKGGSSAYSVVLHLYDHCPFCIRVDLALGWANVNYQRKLYGYGDIEGPKALTGEKVPLYLSSTIISKLEKGSCSAKIIFTSVCSMLFLCY